MKWVGPIICAFLVVGSSATNAAVRIRNDPGGQIGKYLDRYERLRASRQPVIIDGFCASACTIVLATIPSERICMTSQATLAFHAAWDFGPAGRAVTNPDATQLRRRDSAPLRWVC